ncbi:GP46-like surface antigen, putative, partial [Bodo saltans]
VVILDFQNNSYLHSDVATLPLNLFVATVCGTGICSVTTWPSQTLVCLPSGMIANIVAEGGDVLALAGTLEQLAVKYSTGLPRCATTAPSTTPSSSPDTNSTANITSNDASVAMTTTSAAATIATITTLVSVVTGVDAMDAQMLVSILGSPCTCTATSLTASSSDGWSSVLLIALSPFSPLGASWAVIGNSLLCCALVATHMLCVYVVDARETAERRQDNNQRRQRQSDSTPTFLGRYLTGGGGGRWRRRALMRLHFPNLSVSLVLLSIPGVVRGVTSVMDSFTQETTGLGVVAVIIGTTFAVLSGLAIEFVVYSHICAELFDWQKTERRGAKQLHFQAYFHVEELFSPVSRVFSRAFLPQGVWEPSQATKAYGGIVASYNGNSHRWWCVSSVVNLVVQILSGIGGDHSSCDALQSLTMIVLASAATFFAVIKPHRALLASYLTCVSLLLSCVATLLAMLCRLGNVDRSTVDGFGVFVSVVTMIMKVYTIGYSFIEGMLLKRNNVSPQSVVANESLSSSFVLSSFGGLPPTEAGRRRGGRASDVRSVTTPSSQVAHDNASQKMYKTRTQDEALEMLIELIVSRVREL